jgi:uncharacterized membrane protein
LHLKRYILSGLLTIIPLWVTWLLFEFIFRRLSEFGQPWVRVLAASIREDTPVMSRLLLEPWFQNVLAVALVLLALYLLGWMVSRVVGRRVLHAFESLVDRLPGVQKIYGSVKQLVTVLQQKPTDVQRVVLIDFPSADLKAVGLVTRTLVDAETGDKLAAVYVPTTPNPTSGYLEIVPIERITSTDWTVDEAMNFLISGGAVGPDTINYSQK